MARPKTAHIHVRRPYGVLRTESLQVAVPTAKSNDMLASLGLLRLLVTHPQDALQPADPEGGVHGCTPFSDRAMDGESENPMETELASEQCRGRPLSLLTFFAAAKKVSRRRRKRLALKRTARPKVPP